MCFSSTVLHGILIDYSCLLEVPREDSVDGLKKVSVSDSLYVLFFLFFWKTKYFYFVENMESETD